MERKIQNGDGYVFNHETKELETYEFVSARFRFDDTLIRYEAVVGGKYKAFESGDDFEVYESIKDFKEQNHMRPSVIGNQKIRREYVYIDGEARRIDARKDTFVLQKGSSYVDVCGGESYNSLEEVYLHHDIVVRKSDGTEQVIIAPKKQLEMTDEQKALIGELKDVLEKLSEAKVQLFYDGSYERLAFVNKMNVDDMSWGYDCRSYIEGDVDDYVDVVTIMDTIASPIAYINDDSDVMVRFKK